MEKEFFKFSQQLLEDRYLLRGRDNQLIEDADQLLWRVAFAVAEAERTWGGEASVCYYAKEFFTMMKNLLFLPNSPTLMNAGTSDQYLSACFVFPVVDSMKGIFDTLHRTALVHQKGGGTGFNFSSLRPASNVVNGNAGVALGPLKVIELFDQTTEKIKQGGKRRGANIGILNVNHPDITSFISSKSERKRLRNFNLSVGVSDEFMEAVDNDAPWSLVNPRNEEITQTMPARQLWKEIAKNAWASGDPGLIFLDTINRQNPVPMAGEICSTNPCGEVPLLPNESCNLGSINISNCVLENEETPELDWGKLERVVELGIRFLDDVIEVNTYCDEVVKTATLANRKIGLGIMGWADLLIKLSIPYASYEAVQLGERVMEFISRVSRQASSKLGRERGNFPNWGKSIFYPSEPMRNATRNSIAPTGTISILAQTSASIEPIFALAYRRKGMKEGSLIPVIHPVFWEYLQERSQDAEGILEEVLQSGTCRSVSSLSLEEKEWFKTALEIDSGWHIRHQIAFQKFTDNAVSKTINLPETASADQVEAIFYSAWKQGLKGITVFRNTSRQDQVMKAGWREESDPCQAC